MANTISIKAYAKINLFLEVLGRLPDGYHELSTILQSIDLFDEIELTVQEKGITLTCSDPTLPTDSKNLAYRAAELLKKESKVNSGVSLHIEKNIPMGAGLGGGSADAAAVLVGCNQLWNLNYSKEKLEELGIQLGMDVPFCVKGGTALARNRGEIIQERYPTPNFWIVLIYPNISVSTKLVYETLDKKSLEEIAKPDLMIKAIQSSNVNSIAIELYNKLEEITLSLYPEIDRVKKNLSLAGCLNVLMTGSGSAVFGICQNQQEAEKIADIIQHRTSYWTRAISTKSSLK